MNKRSADRRMLRSHCTLRYFAPDGESVLESVGKARDVSRGGIAIVTDVGLKRRAAVHLQVHSSDGRLSTLTGEVRFSRKLGEKLFLIGVKFRELDDGRLTPSAESARRISR